MGIFGKIHKALKKVDPVRKLHKDIQGDKKKKPAVQGATPNGVGSRVVRDDDEEPKKPRRASNYSLDA